MVGIDRSGTVCSYIKTQEYSLFPGNSCLMVTRYLSMSSCPSLQHEEVSLGGFFEYFSEQKSIREVRQEKKLNAEEALGVRHQGKPAESL